MSGLAHTQSHPNDLQSESTSSHPPAHSPDPTLTSTDASSHKFGNASQGGQSAAPSASTAQQPSSLTELSALRTRLSSSLRQYPDFPSPGILFEDILPIFADHDLHSSLLRALELHIAQHYSPKPDVVVGLDARGFLFGPSLALRLGAGFVPVRKRGKLPGEVETEEFKKEYGADFFQIQKGGAIKEGSRVLVVDDIIATGGSAAAAGNLVKKLGGSLLGYVFILELDFLHGRDKLDAPVYTLLSSQESK